MGSEMCIRDRRGATDGVKDADATPWSDLGVIFRTPTYVLFLIEGILGCLPWGIIVTFLVDYLCAAASQDTSRRN